MGPWLLKKCPPLTYRDVHFLLTCLGFQKETKGRGTSHEQWRKTTPKKPYKVTVSPHNQPYTGLIIKSMASQAGVSKKAFCSLADKRKCKDYQRGKIKIPHK